MPGGYGTRALMHDEQMLGVGARRARDVASGPPRCAPARSCSGAAGILDGLEATTHWAVMDTLGRLGAIPVSRRVVEQGKVITAAGVSSGIDMALTLAAHIAGEDVARAIQLAIEYDPEPPFDSGSIAKALAGRSWSWRASERDRHRARGRTAGPGRAPRRRDAADRPAHEHVSTPCAAGAREPVERQLADVEVAAEHERRVAGPAAARSRRRARGVADRAAAVQVRHPDAGVVQPHGVHPAPLGPDAQSPHPVLDDRVAADEDRVGAAAVRLDQRRASARRIARRTGSSALREVSTSRSLGAAGAHLGAGHHGGTSWSSATSHSQPAERGGELVEQVAAGRRHRAPVLEVPGEHAQRPQRPTYTQALPRHFITGSELSADELHALIERALELKARPVQLRRAAQALGGADLPEAVDPHPRVVRGRDHRARRPPDGAAHRRSPAHPRRVGPRHRVRPLAPRRRDRDPNRR